MSNDARITPRIKNEKTVKQDGQKMRQLTAKQLCVLLYHFYIGLTQKNEIGFPDSDSTALKFQSELNQMVVISTEHLEKLLFSLEYAYELGMYFNPADEDFDYFVKGLLEKDEHFERLMCLILKKKGK
jgi:hypothetical protein